MTLETQLKHQVKDYLKIKGIFFYHNLLGIGAFKGIPDLIAVKEGKFVGIELKAPKGKQSDNQLEFEGRLRQAGGEYILARQLEDVMNYFEQRT